MPSDRRDMDMAELRAAAAATRLAKLVALDLLEVEDVLPPLISAVFASGYRGDTAGLRTRLIWTFHDVEADWRRAALLAERDISRAIRPMFASWDDITTIRNAAFGENARRGDPLLGWQVRRLIDAEASEFLQSQRFRRGRRHAGR
jgi:hypothetical protein